MKTLLFSLSLILLFALSATAQDVEACVKHIVTPSYPPLAVQARLQGEVKVEVTLAANGSVQSAKAAGPNEVLSRAAEENVRNWSFSATMEESKLTVTYEYKLVPKDEPTVVIFDLPHRVEITARPAEVIDAYPAKTRKLPQ
jgi:TonB family protein